MNPQSLIETVRAEFTRLGQGENVYVQAHDGVVILTGHVADPELRRIVGQEILRLPQVFDVRNELEIPTPPGDLAQQFAARLEQEGVASAGMRLEAPDGRGPADHPATPGR